MNSVTIIIVVAVFMITVIGLAYILASVNSESTSQPKDNKNRIKDLINVFQSFQAPTKKRSEAMHELIELETPEALEALVEALAHRDDPLWIELLTLLPAIGQPVYPFFSKSFRNASSRTAIIRIMQSVGPNSARWMQPYLNDPSLKTQHEAVVAMEKSGWLPGKDSISAAYWIAKGDIAKCIPIGHDAVQPLLDALKQSESIEELTFALGEIGDVLAGPPILKMAKDPRRKPLVVKTISKWGNDCLSFILPALKDPEEQIRETVIEILDSIQWNPPHNEDGVSYWIEKKRWEKCLEIGVPAINSLIAVVKGTDLTSRQNAIQVLGLIGDPIAIPLLLGTLKDSDVSIQIAGLMALGCFKDSEVAQSVTTVLSKDHLAPTAMKSLSNMGDVAIEPLITALKSNDSKIRSRAAEVLKMMKWEAASMEDKVFMAIALQDWETVIKLGSLANEILVKELAYPETCGSAAMALARIGDPQSIGPIINALKDKPAYAQNSLVEAIGKFGSRAIDAILDAFKQDGMPIGALVNALGRTGDPRVIETLISFLSTRNPISIREIACNGLADFGLPIVDPLLSALLHNNLDPHSAGSALGRAGIKARDKIIGALNNKRLDIQTLIIALGKMPDTEAARAIIGVMHGGEGARYGTAIRNAAQDALLEIGPKAIPPLIEALAIYPSDQAVFSPVLIKMDQIALDPLISTLRISSQSWQRQAIIEILGSIGDKKAINTLLEIQNAYPIHKNHINDALAKIQRSG